MVSGPEWGHGMWRYKKNPIDDYRPTRSTYAAKDYDDSDWELLQAPIASSMYVYPGRPGHLPGSEQTWLSPDSGDAKQHGFPNSIVPNETFWVRKHFSREEMEDSYNEAWFEYPQAETRRIGMPGILELTIYGMIRLWWNGRMVTKNLPSGGSWNGATFGLPIEDDNVAAICVSRISTTLFPHPVGDRYYGIYVDAYPLRGALPGGWNTGPLTFGGGGIQPVPWPVKVNVNIPITRTETYPGALAGGPVGSELPSVDPGNGGMIYPNAMGIHAGPNYPPGPAVLSDNSDLTFIRFSTAHAADWFILFPADALETGDAMTFTIDLKWSPFYNRNNQDFYYDAWLYDYAPLYDKGNFGGDKAGVEIASHQYVGGAYYDEDAGAYETYATSHKFGARQITGSDAYITAKPDYDFEWEDFRIALAGAEGLACLHIRADTSLSEVDLLKATFTITEKMP